MRRQERADEVICHFASLQRGRVGRAQLLANGVSEHTIDNRVRQGALIEVHRGVYAVGYVLDDQLAEWRAATLLPGNQPYLSHLGCARLIAPLVPVHVLDIAFDRADEHMQYDPLTLAELFSRYPRHPGCRRLKALLKDRGQGKSRSWLEYRLRPILRGIHPRPRRNHPIELPGRTIEADYAWLAQRFLLEADGRSYHEARLAFESDRARDRAAIAAGYTTMRVTWRQILEEPDQIRRDVEAALRLAQPARQVAQLRSARA
jgi:very-short-patch-repair endonuclease